MARQLINPLLFLLWFPFSLFSQSGTQIFLGSNYGDQAYQVIPTSDGNRMIAGSYETDGSETALFLLCKINMEGDTLWARTYGSDTDSSVLKSFDHNNISRDGVGGTKAFDVIECSAGGYLIAGVGHDLAVGEDDIYVVRTDDAGDTLWTRAYGGLIEDRAHSVIELALGNFLISGYTESFGVDQRDAYLLKIDDSGDTLWSFVLGGSSVDGFKEAIELDNGDIIAVGNTLSEGAGVSDILLVKVDASGNLIWQKTYGGPENDFGNSLVNISGSLILVGSTESEGEGLDDALIMKVDTSGSIIFTKLYGGANLDVAHKVNSGINSYLVTGFTQSIGHGLTDLLLFELDTLGELNWSRTYGGEGFDYGQDAYADSSGTIIVCGYGNSFGQGGDDIIFLELDSVGIHSCHRTDDSLTLANVTFSINSSNLTYQKLSNISYTQTFSGITYIKSTDSCAFFAENEEIRKETFSPIIYPNPANSEIYIDGLYDRVIQLEVASISGIKVLEVKKVFDGMPIDISTLENGIYIISIISNGLRVNRIITKQ